jgi:hypothetical protein
LFSLSLSLLNSLMLSPLFFYKNRRERRKKEIAETICIVTGVAGSRCRTCLRLLSWYISLRTLRVRWWWWCPGNEDIITHAVARGRLRRAPSTHQRITQSNHLSLSFLMLLLHRRAGQRAAGAKRWCEFIIISHQHGCRRRAHRRFYLLHYISREIKK